MTIPAAMNIEQAADALSSVTDWIRKDQQKELSSFGDVRAQQIGATGLSDDFRKGYELGLQTARGVIAMNVALAQAGIKPDQIL